MEKLQYDSFHKFIVSLGIILITLPIVGYIFFIKSEPIILNQNDFNTLSTFSLKMINEKWIMIETFTRILPFLSIILFLSGSILIIYGCKKWGKIQKQLDDQIGYDTTIKKFNVQKMNILEIKFKTAKELLEENNSEDCGIITNSTMSTSQKHILKYIKIEDLCFSKISKKYSKEYNLKRYLRIGKYEYDFIGISKKDNIDLIFEVKYWNNIQHLNSIVENSLHRLVLSGKNYEKNVCRDVKLILIIVSTREKINEIKYKKFDENSNIEICYYVEKDLY